MRKLLIVLALVGSLLSVACFSSFASVLYDDFSYQTAFYNAIPTDYYIANTIKANERAVFLPNLNIVGGDFITDDQGNVNYVSTVLGDNAYDYYEPIALRDDIMLSVGRYNSTPYFTCCVYTDNVLIDKLSYIRLLPWVSTVTDDPTPNFIGFFISLYTDIGLHEYNTRTHLPNYWTDYVLTSSLTGGRYRHTYRIGDLLYAMMTDIQDYDGVTYINYFVTQTLTQTKGCYVYYSLGQFNFRGNPFVYSPRLILRGINGDAITLGEGLAEFGSNVHRFMSIEILPYMSFYKILFVALAVPLTITCIRKVS